MLQNNKEKRVIVENYLIPNSNIPVKNIYNLFEKIDCSSKKGIFPKEFNISGLRLVLEKIDSEFYYLDVNGNEIQLLLIPIKIVFLINDILEEHDLFCQEQFLSIQKKLKINQPQIIYKKDNKTYCSSYNFLTYIDIYNNPKVQDIYIKSKKEIEIMSEDIFNSLKSKMNSGFLNKTFQSPEDFDKNFYFYFPKEKKTTDKFYIIYSDKRKELCEHLQFKDFTTLRKYFGSKSIGKSITLIGTLKYCVADSFFRTLYVNCQTIDYYSRTDIITCKQILIDEIAYLFFGDYNNYYRVANIIKTFDFDPNDKSKNFWSLILKLFENIPKKKYYILAFDQYSAKNDPFGQLKDIWYKKENMEMKNITILTLCTLNNKDIKEYKLKSLLDEDLEDNIMTYYKEIDGLIEPDKLKISDKEYDDLLEHIGRNIGNYNAINSLIKEKKNVDVFLEQMKKDTKDEIYKYFDMAENLNLTPSKKLFNFLSFSVNSKYTLSEIEDIYDNIPFEYFSIYKEEDLNEENYFEIKYRYPLIQEIFEDIYSDIVLTKIFNQDFYNHILEGGAKGELFEKMVIKKFTPGDINENSVNFFGDFIIAKTYSVPKFVPKKNEQIKLKGNHIITLEKKPFLLKQRIFGGKALDFIIVEYFGKNATFFCFQVTGNKKRSDLMTFSELKKNIETMKSYMENYFDFKISSVYFCYIFDYSKIKTEKITKMCNTLNNYGIKYIFYDTKTETYYDINQILITKIKTKLNEFIFKDNKKIETGYYNLNNKQISEIIKILKKIYKSKALSFKLFNKDTLCVNDLKKYGLFCIIEIKFLHGYETIMIYVENNKYKSVLLDKNGNSSIGDKYLSILTFFKHPFDYYKIIFE